MLPAAGLLPCIFFLFLPLSNDLVPGPVGWDSITEYDWQRIGVVAVLILSVLISACAGCEMPFRGRIWALFLLAGLASIVANHVYRWSAWRELLYAALLMAAFLAVGKGLSSMEAIYRRRLITGCLVGSAALYLIAFFSNNHDAIFEPLYFGEPIRFTPFSNPRFFSDYQALLFPFLIYLTGTRRPWLRGGAWLLALLFFMLFYYTGSRSVIMGQLGAHASLFLILGHRYFPLFRRHVFAWVGAYLAFTVLTDGMAMFHPDMPRHFAIALSRWDLSLRDVIWQIAWQDVVASPLWGIGPGQLSRQLNAVAAAPHNGPLMVAAEWGIVALTGLLVGLGAMVFRAITYLRTLDTSSRGDGEYGAQAALGTQLGETEFLIAAWLAFSSLLLHSLVANVWVIPTSQLALLLSACLIHSSSCRADGAFRQGHAIFPMVGLLVCAGAVFILIRDVPLIPERNRNYLSCRVPTPFFSPRFWQQGWEVEGCPAHDADGKRNF